MAFNKVLPRPGVNVEFSATLNAQGWSASNLMRFRMGLPEKLGGWAQFCTQPVVGTGLGMHSWADFNGQTYLMVGTDQRLQVITGGALYDITPIRQVTNPAVAFSTVITSPTVQIHDAGHGASVGDWIYLVTPVSVGGIVLQGFYRIVTVIDNDNYTVTAASPATATVSGGGAVPQFTTTNTSATVHVTFNNHGIPNGGGFFVEVSTTANGVTLNGPYVITLIDANNFTINASTTATGSGSFFENGGNAQIEYLLPSGVAVNTPLVGYGVGDYGAGDYGLSNSGSITQILREWTGDTWGADLVCNYLGGPIYLFVPPPSGTLPAQEASNPATQISAAPANVTTIFVFSTAQILVAAGSSPAAGGSFDPLLVSWSNQADLNTWIAASNNQAGSRQLYGASRIVGATMTAQGGLIWTDVNLWSMQYIGYPEIFSFTQIGTNCGLIAMRAQGVLNSSVFWMGLDNFYMASPGGGVTVLPCSVWDVVFRNLNLQQLDQINCAVNPLFNEVAWYFPSATGNGVVDTYVKYNTIEQTWDYGSLVRTCWDEGLILGGPVGCDQASLVQQHEVSPDANGQPLNYSFTTGYFEIAQGEEFPFVDQIWPDFVWTPGATVQITISAVDWPGGPARTYGPYNFTSTTKMIPVNVRGRQMQLTFSGSDLGSFVRLGAVRYRYGVSGRRGGS